MKNCPKCRQELPDDAKFCLACGFAFPAETPAPQASAPQQSAPQTPRNPYTEKKEEPAPESAPAPAPAPQAATTVRDIAAERGAQKLVCPSCGNDNLQAVVENNVNTTTSGGGYSAGNGCCGYILFGPLGLLCGACGSKQTTTTTTTNTTWWICNKCGKKFRRPEDLRADIAASERNETVMFAVTIASAIPGSLITALFFAAMGGTLYPRDMTGTMVSISIIADLIVFIPIIFVTRATMRRKTGELEAQLYETERGMRRFR